LVATKYVQNSDKKLHKNTKNPNTKMGTAALLPGVNRPGHEADHSPPRAKVMNACSCTSIFSDAFRAQCSILEGATLLFFTKPKHKITFVNEAFNLTSCT
jgi:hypothetical protein